MRLEDSLNGGYQGLYGEVVESDIYRLRGVADIVSINDPNYIHVPGHNGIGFIPDVVIDLGANVGIFSRYARSLFPKALIIAVEPDESNCNVFREHTNDEKIILLQNAVGKGTIYRCRNATNGAMESYLSPGDAFSETLLKNVAEETNISCLLLSDLAHYIKPGDKTILKIDIEGNEIALFLHEPSLLMLKKFDYIIAELHYFAGNHESVQEVKAIVAEIVSDLMETHDVSLEGGDVYLYAKKKGL